MDTVTMAFARIMKWIFGLAAKLSVITMAIFPFFCLTMFILWAGAVCHGMGSTYGLQEFKTKMGAIPWWFWAIMFSGFFVMAFANIAAFFTQMEERAWYRLQAKKTAAHQAPDADKQ